MVPPPLQIEAVTASIRLSCTCHHIYTWGGLCVWITEWAEGARRACCCPHLTSLKVTLCLGPRTDCAAKGHTAKALGFEVAAAARTPPGLGIPEPEGKSLGLYSISEHPEPLKLLPTHKSVPITAHRTANPQMLVYGKSAAHLFGSQGR